MAKEPPSNSRERAAAIRDKIEKLKQREGGNKVSESANEAPPAAMSPREFIRRRMAELEKKKKS
jgi:hypothetical protein